jgi:hypothetical protein
MKELPQSLIRSEKAEPLIYHFFLPCQQNSNRSPEFSGKEEASLRSLRTVGEIS